MASRTSAEPNVFTFGYTGHTPTELAAELERLNAILIDIRFSPRSRNALWNGSALSRVLGDHPAGRYLHLRAWGNLNYHGDGPLMFADWDAGLTVFKRLRKPVVLMCVEAKPAGCHRAVAGERLRELGYNVAELEIVRGDQPVMRQGRLL